MNSSVSGPFCQDCSSPLDQNGFCLACLFREAAEMPPGSEAAAGDESGRPTFAAIGKLPLPCAFAHHSLLREVGSGGMGIVYEAQDLRLKRIVALKLIRSAAFARAEEIIRFKSEAETVARLDHPNIVPVLEVGEFEGHPWFSMKLVTGTTLAARLKDGPLPPREAAAMMQKLAAAVQHAHDRGVLHRDLKPGNVLLDQTGEPVLTDFGLARIADVDSALTLSTARLGTPQYMSPEQARGGTKDVTTASDVWALGVMFYQMLTGRVPFEGANHQEIFHKVLEQEPAPLHLSESAASHSSVSLNGGSGEAKTTFRNRLDRDLNTLCLRCLQKEPPARLASAHEFSTELGRWLRGEPIRARRITNGERIIKWMRRHPWRVAVLTLTAFFIVAGSITSLVLWRRAENARDDADLNAAAAHAARDLSAADAYFASIGNALTLRTRGDLAGARKLLARAEERFRGFEWQLLNGVCRGDDDWTIRPAGHPETLAWDPGNRRLVLLGADRRLRFADPVTGGIEDGPLIPPRPPGTAESGFSSLTISPDGRRWACAEGDNAFAGEMASGQILHSAPVGPQPSLAWLDAGRLLAGAVPDRLSMAARNVPPAFILDLSSGKMERLPDGVHGPVAVSPDGQKVAWVDDINLQVRNTAALDGPPLVTIRSSKLSTDQGLARHVVFNGDGSFLSVHWAFQTSILRTYSLPAGKLEAAQASPPIAALALSPEEPALAFAGTNDWLNVLHYTMEIPKRPHWDDDDDEAPDTYDPGGPYEPPPRFLTRTAQEGRFRVFLGNESRAAALTIPPGFQSLFSLGRDGTLSRFPMVSKAPQNRKPGVRSSHLWEHPVASPNGLHVLFLAEDFRCRVWHRLQGDRTRFGAGLMGIAVFNDARTLTIDRATGDLIMWQAPNDSPPEELWRLPAALPVSRGTRFSSSSVSPDGNTVVSLFDSMILRVNVPERTANASPAFRPASNDIGCRGIDLSPDGRWIAVTGIEGGRALLFDSSSLTASPRPAGPATLRSGFDTVCAFSRDGLRLYVGNDDGYVRVFDPSSGNEFAGESWEAGSRAVSALALSQDGRTVAACSGDIFFFDAMPDSGGRRRERLRISNKMERNWLHFACGDTVFLHCGPWRSIEAWETRR